MSNDRPLRGDLALGPERYDHPGAPAELVDAIREGNLEAVRPPDVPRVADVPRELLLHEQQVRLLPSPRRNGWKEIQRFDERVAEVDAHQHELAEEARRVGDELRAAPDRDGDALSTWEVDGKAGPEARADRARP